MSPIFCSEKELNNKWIIISSESIDSHFNLIRSLLKLHALIHIHPHECNKAESLYVNVFIGLMIVIITVFCLPGETERAATYCHSTLQRQLQLNQFSPMEWALNAATLSQYYITKVGLIDGFK